MWADLTDTAKIDPRPGVRSTHRRAWLECGAWRTQRRDMWADLTDTAKIDPRVHVAEVISQALASDNRSILRRVVLEPGQLC